MRFLHPGNSSVQSGKLFLVMHSARDARQFELSSIHSGVNRSDKKHGFSLSYVQFVIFRLTRWFILRVCNGRRGNFFFLSLSRVFLTMALERRSDRCHFCRRKISPRTKRSRRIVDNVKCDSCQQLFRDPLRQRFSTGKIISPIYSLINPALNFIFTAPGSSSIRSKSF